MPQLGQWEDQSMTLWPIRGRHYQNNKAITRWGQGPARSQRPENPGAQWCKSLKIIKFLSVTSCNKTTQRENVVRRRMSVMIPWQGSQTISSLIWVNIDRHFNYNGIAITRDASLFLSAANKRSVIRLLTNQKSSCSDSLYTSQVWNVLQPSVTCMGLGGDK